MDSQYFIHIARCAVLVQRRSMHVYARNVKWYVICMACIRALPISVAFFFLSPSARYTEQCKYCRLPMCLLNNNSLQISYTLYEVIKFKGTHMLPRLKNYWGEIAEDGVVLLCAKKQTLGQRANSTSVRGNAANIGGYQHIVFVWVDLKNASDGRWTSMQNATINVSVSIPMYRHVLTYEHLYVCVSQQNAGNTAISTNRQHRPKSVPWRNQSPNQQ